MHFITRCQSTNDVRTSLIYRLRQIFCLSHREDQWLHCSKTDLGLVQLILDPDLMGMFGNPETANNRLLFETLSRIKVLVYFTCASGGYDGSDAFSGN